MKNRKTQRTVESADRLPPHAPEAEQGLLGCVLLDPEGGMNQCEERGVTAEWFYDLRHQLIWNALAEMHKAAKPIGTTLLYQHLKDSGTIDQAGGLTYLATLPDTTPSAYQLPGLVEVLWDKFVLRSVVRTGTEMVTAAYSIEEGEKTDTATLIARAEREVLRLSEEKGRLTESQIKEVILRVIDKIEDYHRGHAQISGLTTGLDYLDKLLCGYGGEKDNFLVVAARPGQGKTALATQIADHVAIDHVWWDPVLVDGPNGKKIPATEIVDGQERIKFERRVGRPVGIFSLEMTKEGLTQRMLFRRARADVQRWRTGFAVKEDFDKLAQAAPKLAIPNNIIIEDQGIRTFESIKAKARRWVRQYGCRLFVLDYIQLLRSGDRSFREDRVRELEWISTSIQELGKELRVPIIVVAQLNRDVEKDPNRPPRLSDLKGCGQLEQDADIIMFLYKRKLKDEQQEQFIEMMTAEYGDKNGKPDWSGWPQLTNLLIEKARNGPTGECQLLFHKSWTGFEDYNVWMKSHGHKAPAAGESGYRDLPTNEELDL